MAVDNTAFLRLLGFNRGILDVLMRSCTLGLPGEVWQWNLLRSVVSFLNRHDPEEIGGPANALDDSNDWYNYIKFMGLSQELQDAIMDPESAYREMQNLDYRHALG